MTITCSFCQKPCEKNKGTRTIYCSSVCNKRAWWARHKPNSYWANSASQEFWNSDTGKGLKWEKYAADLLGAKHLLFNKRGPDLEKDGKFYDVKVSTLYKRKNKRGKPVIGEQAGVWAFKGDNVYVKDSKLDYYVCIGLDENQKVVKALLVPKDEYSVHGITVGANSSKYDQYSINQMDGLRDRQRHIEKSH